MSNGSATMTAELEGSADSISTEAIHAALVSGERPRPASGLTATMSFAWRSMLKIKHVPEQLIDVTITPVLFLVMFTYLFGGAVAGSTSEYLQYIFPGLLVQSILFTTVYSGVTLNTDLTKGVIDRIRSLPVWSPAPLLGAAVGDLARFAFAGLILLVFGLILGFDIVNGVQGLIAGLLLTMVFAFALSWVFMALGLVLRSPSAVMNSGFMGLFPLIFISNIFVLPSTMGSFLQTLVDLNPVTHLVTAVRGLMGDGADWSEIGLVLAEAGVLVAIFLPLTTHLYRSRA